RRPGTPIGRPLAEQLLELRACDAHRRGVATVGRPGGPLADAVAGAPLALELRLTLAQLKHGLGTPIQVRKSVLSAYAQTDAAQGGSGGFRWGGATRQMARRPLHRGIIRR